MPLRKSVDNIGFLTVDVARLLRRRFDHELDRAGLGITAGEARTLANASRFDGVRQNVLAELMGVEPMTLVSFLDRLEARGLIERVPDPSDRRAKLVQPTEAARPVLERILEIGTLVRARATVGMSPAQVEALRDTLAAMRASLMAGEPAETPA